MRFSGDAIPVSVCVNTILTHAIQYLCLASNLRIQIQIFLRRNSVCLTRYSLRPECGHADLINWKLKSVNSLTKPIVGYNADNRIVDYTSKYGIH